MDPENLEFLKFGSPNSSRLVVLFHGLTLQSAARTPWETEWVNAMIEEDVAVLSVRNPSPFPRDLRSVARLAVAHIVSEYASTGCSMTFVGHSLGGMIAMEAAALMMAESAHMASSLVCVVLVATAGKQGRTISSPQMVEALQILDDFASTVPNSHDAYRTMIRLRDWGLTKPNLHKFITSPMVLAATKSAHREMTGILLQLRAALAWMVDDDDGENSSSPARHQLRAAHQPPKFTIIAAGLDSVLPAKENSRTIISWLRRRGVPDSRQEYILLNNSDHSVHDVFTGKDGAEYVLRCGGLSLLSRLKIGLRILRTDPTHRLVAQILVVIIVCGIIVLAAVHLGNSSSLFVHERKSRGVSREQGWV
jgi:pimeloyl-ACP methyl ester carboxylesterase